MRLWVSATIFLVMGFFSPAVADDHTVYFYGKTQYEIRYDSGLGSRTIIISAQPTTCEDYAWQAKLIMDQSGDWLGFRELGKRRIESKNLVFFQYQGLNFRMPYREHGNQSYYYD